MDDLMEQLVAALSGLPDGTPDAAKSGIKTLFQQVNQKAGKAATDLESYKTGAMSYQKLKKKMAEHNLTEDQLDTIAEELGVKKTLQDELAIKEVTTRELNKKVRDLEGTITSMKMESTVGAKATEAAKSYKTPDGKTVKLSDKFIDKKELFKPIDLSSDVVVQDRVQSVLKAAYESQVAFMKEVGMEFQGQPVHAVKTGEGVFGSGKALDPAAIAAVLKDRNGDLDSAAMALTMLERSGAIYGQKE